MRRILRLVSVVLFLASAWLAVRAGTPSPELVQVIRDGRPWLVRPSIHRDRDLRLAAGCAALALTCGTSWIGSRPSMVQPWHNGSTTSVPP